MGTVHYGDVIMSMHMMASQITSLTIVFATIYSCADQRKHQSSASLAFVRGIHRWPANSPHKGPVTRKILQILQNKAKRITTGSPPRTYNETLYRQNYMLNLNKINTYLVGKFMYNVYHCIVPDIFEGMFVYNNMIHYNDTRISGHLHPPTISSNLSQNSIRYHGVIIWNKILTAAINPDSSEVYFKIMLKKGIQQEVITHY